MTGKDEHHYEWTKVFEFPTPRMPIECLMFSSYGKKRKARLCFNPPQGSNGATFHPHCFRESLPPDSDISLGLHLKSIWNLNLWTSPWPTASFLDDLEIFPSVQFAPTAEELDLTLTHSRLLWRLAQLPPEINDEIMRMSYGSPLWKHFAARKQRARISGMIGEPTAFPLTTINCWKRADTYINFDSTGSHLTVTIDAFGIKSLQVSSAWPSSVKNEATDHEVYVIEPMCNLRGLQLQKMVFT